MDLGYIKTLLGYNRSKTTEIYTPVSYNFFQKSQSHFTIH